MKLALGTVQFGLPYGIANWRGQVPFAEVREILAQAAAMGIDTLDTAAAYGESEQRLGEAGVGAWRIISKLPAIPAGVGDVDVWVRKVVENSLRLLRVPRLAGLLLHRPAELSGPHGPALARTLGELSVEGVVGKTGISIYSPTELVALLPHPLVQIVQAPFNVLDRRLTLSGWLGRLQDAGVEVHIRSIFLQGLLLFPRAARPAQFDRWQALWRAWDDYLQRTAQSPLEACVRFALAEPGFARVVVGVDSLAQLREIVRAGEEAYRAVPDALGSNDRQLIEPPLWPSPDSLAV